MTSNFEKVNYPYETNKSKVDLRSYALKASDYINYLAKEAGVEQDRFVHNALLIIRSFSLDHSLINNQVKMIEQRLSRRIEQRRRGNSNLPSEVFRNGVVNTGKVVGSNIDARLKIEHFSGNAIIYGQYGMGKTNLNLNIIPQLIKERIHVDIFDVAVDYRDILQISGCDNGLVLNPDNDMFNPLEPIGSPEEHLQFIWEISQQDFNFRDETKEMLFNYSSKLYEKFKVDDGGDPPSFHDLKEFIKEEKSKTATTAADKRKIETALRKLNYIMASFKGMTNCSRGYSLDHLDRFSFVSYEIGNLSEDKRSWYMKLKLRKYQHKGLNSNERHKVKRMIVVDEAKGIFGKSRIGISTNFIKDMYTKSRSIGCWWIISDQFATELADFTRAASCQISFQHTIPKEIREIATGMGCNEAQKILIPQLGRYKALQKIADYPFPYQIMTYKSKVQRHISDAELNNVMRSKIADINSQLTQKKTFKRARIINNKKIASNSKHTDKTVKAEPLETTNPLQDIERFLRFVDSNPGMKLTAVYKGLKLSGRKGDALKSKALENGLIIEKVQHRGKKGRPVKELKLTDEGKRYIDEK